MGLKSLMGRHPLMKLNPLLRGMSRAPTKSKRGAPKTDYTKLAEQTANSNREAQTFADFANRPTINTPYGSQEWISSLGVDPATGQKVTNWTQNTRLNPLAQRSLDAQQQLGAGRSELAQGMLGRVQSETSKPFDWASMPQRANAPMTRNIDAGVGDASRQRIEQGLLGRLRGERDYQTSRLETRLANQGLTPGSEGYKRLMQDQNDQFSRDEFNALTAGGQEQQNQFNMARDASSQGFDQDLQAFNAQNQNRQSAIGEQSMQRSTSLNELNSLLGGQQVGMPEMPEFITSRSTGGVDYSGAGQQQHAAEMDKSNARDARRAATMGAVTKLAGSVIGAIPFSDARLKSNIVQIGVHPRGIGIYEYDIFGRRERGVMAQELLAVAPELVHVHPSGFMMVDYRSL